MISIAMATYNGERYIREQLKSLADQSQLPDELVISDDASTDATIGIVRDFARTAPFEIRVERNKKNLGYSQNFGKAIGSCTGDIIFLCDQDDVWLPQKLERVLREFRVRPETYIIINNARIVDENLQDTELTKLGQTRSLGLDDRAFLTGCCTALRADFRSIMLPIPDGIFVHDTWLHSLADKLSVRTVIEECLQLYRRHGNNASAALSSTTMAMGWKDLFMDYSKKDSRVYTERVVKMIEIQRHRLESCRGKVTGLSDHHFDRALRDIEIRGCAAQARLDLLSRERLGRILPASAMYLRGQYSHFSGWRSLAKDLLKP